METKHTEGKELIRNKATEYANRSWDVSDKPNEHDNAFEDFQNGALWMKTELEQQTTELLEALEGFLDEVVELDPKELHYEHSRIRQKYIAAKEAIKKSKTIEQWNTE